MKQVLKNLFLFFGLFLLSTLISCNGSFVPINESIFGENENLIVITPDFEVAVLDLEEKLDSLKYVKLELSDESLIGEIAKVEVFEDRIYVLDTQTYSLFVFTINGNYLFKINDLGNGPGEYVQLDFFTLDRKNRKIFLTDLMSNFIMEYNLDGEYVSRKKIPFWVRGIEPLGENGYFIFSNYVNNRHNLNQEFNYLYTNTSFDIVKGYISYNSKLIGQAARHFSNPREGNFYQLQNNLYFFDNYSEIVYHIEESELIPHVLFDLKSRGFNADYLNIDPKVLSDYMNENSFYRLAGCLETDEFIVYAFTLGPYYWHGFYCKKTGNNLTAGIVKNGTEFLNYSNISHTDSWIIAVENVEYFFYKKEHFRKEKISGAFIEMTKEFAQTVEIDDNPVLIFYKLKEF